MAWGILLTSGQPSSLLRTFVLFLFILTVGVCARVCPWLLIGSSKLVGKEVAFVPLLALGRITQVHSECSSMFRCFACVCLRYRCHTVFLSVNRSVGKGCFYSFPTSLPLSDFYFSIQMLEYIGLRL